MSSSNAVLTLVHLNEPIRSLRNIKNRIVLREFRMNVDSVTSNSRESLILRTPWSIRRVSNEHARE